MSLVRRWNDQHWTAAKMIDVSVNILLQLSSEHVSASIDKSLRYECDVRWSCASNESKEVQIHCFSATLVFSYVDTLFSFFHTSIAGSRWKSQNSSRDITRLSRVVDFSPHFQVLVILSASCLNSLRRRATALLGPRNMVLVTYRVVLEWYWLCILTEPTGTFRDQLGPSGTNRLCAPLYIQLSNLWIGNRASVKMSESPTLSRDQDANVVWIWCLNGIGTLPGILA